MTFLGGSEPDPEDVDDEPREVSEDVAIPDDVIERIVRFFFGPR
jgi:hypothetical protein